MKEHSEPKKWITTAGKLSTSSKTNKTKFIFPELHNNKLIKKSIHVVGSEQILRYDMIIGRDLITELGIDIKGSDLSIYWDDAAIPWRDIDSTINDAYLSYSPIHQPEKAEKRTTQI